MPAPLPASIVLTVAGLAAATATPALTLRDLAPDGAFAQAGYGGHETESFVLGTTWDWRWRRQTSVGKVTGFHEISFGRWVAEDASASGSAWVSHVGLTPSWRLQFARLGGNWFVEGGIGANVILPLYRNRQNRFGSEFNFGEHVGVGCYFGTEQRHEVVVRGQHFSNAGIQRPNPGENFIQLRYAQRLR